ncbi:hypothetical protein PINS_up000972 [Pythium insidiosum]|nr:hypothetical protein PINS_up000972 [Pythium insidiosum]
MSTPPPDNSSPSSASMAPTSLLLRFHHWKNRHQFLARYSIEKLVTFHEYQRETSWLHVALVVLLSPLPVLAVLLVIELIPLGDPLAGARHNAHTIIRSAFAHTTIAISTTLSVGASLGLTRALFSLARVVFIGLLVGVFGELVWLPAAFYWRYPVPFRELANVVVFSILLALFIWIFARPVVKHVLQSLESRRQLNSVMQVAGLQLVLFYGALGVSVGFARVSLYSQIALVLAVPIIKIGCKRFLWRLCQQCPDVSTDITVCIVEMASALFQTVSFQYAESRVLNVLLVAFDGLWAACEVHFFATREFIVDHRTTLATAVKIIDSALFPAVPDVAKAIDLQAPKAARPSVAEIPPPSSQMAPRFPTTRMGTWSCFGRARRGRAVVLPASSIALSPSHERRRSFEAAATSVLLPAGALRAQSHRQVTDFSRLHRVGSLSGSLSRGMRLEDKTGIILGRDGAIVIDGLSIERREQARLLEQSLQLLFSCEVLLFAELMEMFVPLVYATYIAVAWHLPNASYNLILMSMSRHEMMSTVTSALVFATLEMLSFLGLCWAMQRKYGISVFHLLAFVLEKYWASLYGKLIGCFMTVLMFATLHQGIDWSFKFDFKAMLERSGRED